MRSPETIETNRLLLRRPVLADAEAIFWRYASDPEVTRFLSWPRHRSVEETRAFLAFSDCEWEKWPAGPYLVEDRVERRLLGGAGLGFRSPTVAETGYVLARDAWGFGYATEALGAVVGVAAELGVEQLLAFRHPANTASARVLEKCGFLRDDSPPLLISFPNAGEDQPAECMSYVRKFGGSR
jgi:ribosomal-protein-alanine N-acetyltransferase